MPAQTFLYVRPTEGEGQLLETPTHFDWQLPQLTSINPQPTTLHIVAYVNEQSRDYTLRHTKCSKDQYDSSSLRFSRSNAVSAAQAWPRLYDRIADADRPNERLAGGSRFRCGNCLPVLYAPEQIDGRSIDRLHRAVRRCTTDAAASTAGYKAGYLGFER
jgi:hypothetical protein